jgi:phytoene desaturase
MIDMPDTVEGLGELFESREKGAGQKMLEFLKQAKYKYDVGMADFVQRPSVSITEFTDIYRLVVESVKLHMLTTHRDHVRAYFTDEILVKIMEWPVLFLGGAPDGVPALYSLMDHACE